MDDAKLAANRQYYRNFKAKNPDILTAKHQCEVCGGSYTYFSKSNHNKTQLHRYALQKLAEEIESETVRKFDTPGASIAV